MTDIGYRPTVQYRPKDRPEKIWIDGLQEAYHGIRFTHVAWWLQLHHRSSLFADRLYHVNAALNSQVCNMAIIFITRFFRTRAGRARSQFTMNTFSNDDSPLMHWWPEVRTCATGNWGNVLLLQYLAATLPRSRNLHHSASLESQLI